MPINRSDALDLLVVLAEDKSNDYDRAALSTLLFEDGASFEKLRLTIFHLRKAVGATYIPHDTQKEAKRLRFLRKDLVLDTDEFSRRATQLLKGTPHAHTGTQFIQDVTETLAIYQTHFLKDYHFVTRAMTDWKETHQQRLAHLREQLLGELVRFFIQQGALTDAQQHAELWYTTSLEARVVPLQHLIWIAVSRQRIVEVQQHLAKLQQAEEQGIGTWGPTVMEWRRRIFEKTDVPLSLLDIASARTTPYSVANLTDFIERPALSQRFADLLLNSERLDVIGLTGLPGAGKTSFAQSVFETVRRKNPRKRIAWVDLNNESDLEVLLNDVVSQLDMKQLLPLDYTTKQRRFRQMIKAQSTSIVVDEGVSQKFSAPEFLDSVVTLFEGTQLTLIARDLPETRFYLFHVPGLEKPDMQDFLSRHLSAQEIAQLDAADVKWFDRLTAITGGLPLALSLITGAVTGNRYTLPRLIREMPVERSAWILSNAISRYDAILDWSWQSLSADEKTLLYVMTMFDPSGCLITDVSAVLSAAGGLSSQRVIELVKRLANLRLLSLHGAENAAQRGNLHPIVYRYIEGAIERGETDIPAATLHSAYARYIMSYVEANLHDYSCLDLYRHEIVGMFINAFSQRGIAGSPQNSIRLFNKIYGYFDQRGLYATAQRLLDSALEVADTSMPERVGLLCNVGQSAFKRGAYDEAHHWLTEADTLARHHEDMNARGLILRDLGRIAHIRGQYSEALDIFEQGLAAATEDNQLVIAAQIMANQGMVSAELGQIDRARMWFERISNERDRAREIDEQSGFQDVLQFVETQLGRLLLEDQAYDAADKHFQRALTQARNLNNPERIARAYLNLGALRYVQRDLEAAWDYFTQGSVVADHIQHSELLIWFMWNKGVLRAIAGDYKVAGNLLRMALGKANDLGLRTATPYIYISFGIMHLCQLQFERARQYFIEIFRQAVPSTRYVALGLYGVALTIRYEKDLLLHDAVETARQQIFDVFATYGIDTMPLPNVSRKDIESAELHFKVALMELPEMGRFHIIDAVMAWLKEVNPET